MQWKILLIWDWFAALESGKKWTSVTIFPCFYDLLTGSLEIFELYMFSCLVSCDSLMLKIGRWLSIVFLLSFGEARIVFTYRVIVEII